MNWDDAQRKLIINAHMLARFRTGPGGWPTAARRYAEHTLNPVPTHVRMQHGLTVPIEIVPQRWVLLVEHVYCPDCDESWIAGDYEDIGCKCPFGSEPEGWRTRPPRMVKPKPGACGDPECHVLHDDPDHPIHPPWYVDSRTRGT